MTSRVLEYHWFSLIAWFKSLGSKHNLMLPPGFVTGMIKFTHYVCQLTSMIIPSHTSLSNYVLYADCIPTGTEQGGCCTGVYFSFNLIWYGSPGRIPTPWNTSANSFNRYSLMVGILCTLSFTMTSESLHSMSQTTGYVKTGLCNLEVCDTPLCCVLGFSFSELCSPPVCKSIMVDCQLAF